MAATPSERAYLCTRGAKDARAVSQCPMVLAKSAHGGALLRKTPAKGSNFGRCPEYSPLNTEKKGRSPGA